jgi:hypothetical protein
LKIAIALLVAVGIGVEVAMRMMRDGASDFSYIFFMSLAAVVAIAIVAPGKFGEGGDRPPWERPRPGFKSKDDQEDR